MGRASVPTPVLYPAFFFVLENGSKSTESLPHTARSITDYKRCHFHPHSSISILLWTFSHERLTFAFTPESGYTLASASKIAHSGLHGETRGVFYGGGWYHYPQSVLRGSETLRGRVSERRTLPLLGLGRVCSRRTQRACGTAMRSCASLSRGVAAPLGCVIPLLFLSPH